LAGIILAAASTQLCSFLVRPLGLSSAFHAISLLSSHYKIDTISYNTTSTIIMERRLGRYYEEPIKDPVSGIPLSVFPEPVVVTPDEVSAHRLFHVEELKQTVPGRGSERKKTIVFPGVSPLPSVIPKLYEGGGLDEMVGDSSVNRPELQSAEEKVLEDSESGRVVQQAGKMSDEDKIRSVRKALRAGASIGPEVGLGELFKNIKDRQRNNR
jgi:hypothetical protein